MKTEIKQLPKSEIELEIEFSDAEMQPYLEEAAKALAREHPIEGFRPGNAPYDLAKKHFGEMKLYEKAVTAALNETVPEYFERNKIRSVGHPEVSVKKIAPGNPVLLSVKTAVIPSIQLPDFESITKKVFKTKIEPTVGPKEIEDALTWIRDERSEENVVARPAEKGDAVHIDFKAMREGNDIGGGESKSHPLIIGRGTMVPGFEEELIGMQAGEQKQFSLNIPDSHSEQSIAGKTLDFSVIMGPVRERKVPELSDDFAKTLGSFETMEDVKKSIHEGLHLEKQEKERERLRLAVMDAILEKTPFEIPNALIENELEKMLTELKRSIESMRLLYADYLTHIKKSEDNLKKEWQGEAEKRVRMALLLKAIADTKQIRPNEEEVTEEANKFLSRFDSLEEARKSIDPESLRALVRGQIRNQKVFQYLDSL